MSGEAELCASSRVPVRQQGIISMLMDFDLKFGGWVQPTTDRLWKEEKSRRSELREIVPRFGKKEFSNLTHENDEVMLRGRPKVAGIDFAICASDNYNEHSFSRLAVNKALTCPKGQSACKLNSVFRSDLLPLEVKWTCICAGKELVV